MRKILVIRGGGLGDFILILPVLAALREKWPKAGIELLTHPETGELARISGYAERVHSIDAADTTALFSTLPAEKKKNSLPKFLEGVDLVVNFLPDTDGSVENTLRLVVPRVLSIPQPIDNRIHAASQFLSALQALGIHSGQPGPHLRVHLPHTENEFPPIAVHPGSGSRLKNWKASGFARVILWLADSLGYDSVLITGEADSESRRCLLNELGSRRLPELRNVPLGQLASVLQNRSLFIGNDSGISHLAAALGTPVLAFFGPTSPEVWRPLGERVRVVKFTDARFELVQREIECLLRRVSR